MKLVQKLTQKCFKHRKIDTIVFDVAGTICDKYSRAPFVALTQTFLEDFQIRLTNDVVRKPTGNDKMIHIQAILSNKSVSEQWTQNHGNKPNLDNAKKIFEKYEIRQIELLKSLEFTKMLPKTLSTLNFMQTKYDLKYGITTGYNDKMMVEVLNSLKTQGFVPDSCFASNEIKRPRPYPDGILANLAKLKRYQENCIKIGDTPIDMQEANNSGCISLGIVKYGNKMGELLPDVSEKQALKLARQQLVNAGADFVIDEITELEEVIKFIYYESTSRF